MEFGAVEKLIEYRDIVLGYIMQYVPNILLAIIMFRGGLKMIRWVTKIINTTLTKGHFDITIAKFVSNLINFGLKGLLVITVAGMLGVQTASFVAIIGAAGLALGLALQGSLANFAGGMLILIFKPYQVGDWIEISGEMGKVDEIDILLTRVITRDNKVVIIPNGEAANGKVINRSKRGPMRVEVPVGVSYDTDIEAARKVLLESVVYNPYLVDNHNEDVVVSALNDSSVDLIVRGYCHAQDYPAAYATLLEQAKNALDKANIEIPFPQSVIHMKS